MLLNTSVAPSYLDITVMFDKLSKLFNRGGKQPKAAPTPEQDIMLAERALAEGELAHAAFHAGAALVSNPNNPEWLALLQRIVTCAGDPLELAPLQKDNYAGTVAVRAYILAHLGRYSEALPLILQVVVSLPEAGYLEWPIGWLNNPAARHTVDLEPVVGFMGRFVDPEQRAKLTDAACRATLDRIPAFLKAASETQQPTAHQAFLFVVMLKRLNRLDIAEVVAAKAYAANPDYHSANAMASIYRATGRMDEAVAMYRQAAQFDPSDEAVRLDAGDILADLGRLEEAAAEYEEVLKREPGHPWALPSYYAVQYEQTGQDEWANLFAHYLDANPSNNRARELKRRLRPYFSPMLPSPTEATINAIRQIIEKGFKPSQDGVFAMGLSNLESPSAVMSANMELTRKFGTPTRLKIDVSVGSQPDPREPRVPVQYHLWNYRGIDASPAVRPPAADVTAAVGALASTTYSPQGWWNAAQSHAAAIGSGRVGEVLAAMVHPSPVPAGTYAWDWVYRTQFAAAFIVARMDETWAGSTRRSALMDIANGPVDWSTEAAVVTLCLIAKATPEAEPEVTQLYIDLIKQARGFKGYTCYLEPVLLSALELPNIESPLREYVLDTLKAVRSR